MTDQIDALARAIGGRVRHARIDRQLTLDQLAERAGLSRRMLVNVEQGTTNPSIGSLLKLASALGVALPMLVEQPSETPLAVVRRHEGAVLWSSPSGGSGRLVASFGLPDTTELWEWRLNTGDAHESAAHTPGTRELIQVIEGSMVVEADGDLVELDSGDAVAFAGDVPHSYRNPGATPVRFSLAVFEPGPRSSPASTSTGPVDR